jgi:hypothetical protein
MATGQVPATLTPEHRQTDFGTFLEQIERAYLWTTPAGLHRLVNHTGTHPITDDDLDLVRQLYAA